jgi:excisionase family DNA binding protein
MILTSLEAAKRLGITQRRVIALIATGRLKAKRFGRVYSIEAEDVDAMTVRVNGRPTKALLEIRGVAERPGKDAEVAREMLRRHIEERRW